MTLTQIVAALFLAGLVVLLIKGIEFLFKPSGL